MTKPRMAKDVRAIGGLLRAVAAGIPVPTFAPSDIHSELPLMRRNKVPLLWFDGRRDLPQSWRTAIEADRLRWAKQRGQYALVHEKWTVAGIPHVFIKAFELAPSFPYQSDNLDLLMPRDRSREARDILRSAGFVELRNDEEPHKYLYRHFSEGRETCGVHIHEHIGWIVPFVGTGHALEHARPSVHDPTVTVLSPEDILLTTLAHFFYEDKEIKFLDWIKALHVVNSHEIDWRYVQGAAEGRGWADGLGASLLCLDHVHNLLTGDFLIPEEQKKQAWNAQPQGRRTRLARYLKKAEPRFPFPIPFVLSKRYFFSKIFRDPRRDVRRKWWDAAVHTGYGLRMRYKGMNQRAMLITLSGLDGAGKSSQARILEQAFHGSHIRTRILWSRSGSSPFMSAATKLGKLCLRIPEDPHSTNQKRIALRMRSFRSSRVRFVWIWLASLDLLGTYGLHVRFWLSRGWVVICDRYVYDAIAEWSAYFENASWMDSRLARWLMDLTPHPGKGYVLDLSVEDSSARSGDESPASFLACKRRAYLELARRRGLRLMDAGRDRVTLGDELTGDAVGHYFDGFRTRLNRLFLKNPGQWTLGTRWPDSPEKLLSDLTIDGFIKKNDREAV